MQSSRIFGESIGRPENYEVEKKKIISPFEAYGVDYTIYKDYKVVNWGRMHNDFPQKAAFIAGGTSVLNTG